MILLAQIEPQTNTLIQGLGFSTPELAQTHMQAHPEYAYISTDEFVSPMTHEVVDGQIKRKQQ